MTPPGWQAGPPDRSAVRRDERISVTEYSLLVGAEAFWREAARDIAAARRRVLVQAMTFEGDSAGLAVAEAVIEAGAADRRILVDDYTRHVINDRILLTTRDPAIRAEADATHRMFDRLMDYGVSVRITQPIEGQPLRYPLRNHKKLLVIDDAAWIGGINFSEHNFAWSDTMVRIADGHVADWLASAFEADWQGRSEPARRNFAGGLTLLNLSGTGNMAGFAPVLELLAGARRSLEVLSPYPTFPFLEAMGQAAASGAEVVLYTPRANNKSVVRDYVLHAAQRHGVAVRLLPEMGHTKAALIDGEALVCGSSNFDFVSARASAELVAIIRFETLIAAVQDRLFGVARSQSVPMNGADHRPLRALCASAALHTADALIARLPRQVRTVSWPRLAQARPPG
jgi:cardiolipin synthase A/B